MTDRASLRERVARAICDVETLGMALTVAHFKEADAAIAIVLEEAAKCMEGMTRRRRVLDGMANCEPTAPCEFAAAIREMKEK